MKINGARVLLTGATGGIGHAIARRLKAEGAELVLTGRRTEVLDPLANELGARSIAADLGDPAALEKLLAEAGDLDILVANAALPGVGRMESTAVEKIDANLNVNLRAPMLMTRALLPQLLERGTGVGVSIVEPGFVRDAGMFVDSGMETPRGTRTVSPEQVAAGVVKAITKDRGEVVVAPAEIRLGARFGSLFPSVNDAAQRMGGAAEIASKHADND